MSSLNKGDLVLVTGANGFIASHIVQRLIQDGFRVRGTTRSSEKAAWLHKKFGDSFESVIVTDMTADGAFDQAVKGVSGVIHPASIMTFEADPEKVIPPTIKGAVNALSAAAKESNVKSFVYTSSSSAALLAVPNKEIVVTPDTWNDLAVEQAYKSNPEGVQVYAASKTEAERAIWKFVADKKPGFRVATVLPNVNFGPILEPGAEWKSSTGSWVPQIWKGDKGLLSFPPQWMVDVRDTAKLHVAALKDPETNGQRIFAFAETYNWNEVLGILRKLQPDRKFMEDDPSQGQDLSKIPNKSAKALLQKHYGQGFVSMEESIKANIVGLKD